MSRNVIGRAFEEMAEEALTLEDAVIGAIPIKSRNKLPMKHTRTREPNEEMIEAKPRKITRNTVVV